MEAGLTYGRDYEPMFVKRNIAVEAIKRGDLAAAGMNLSHLQIIRRANPSIPLRVIGRGSRVEDRLVLLPFGREAFQPAAGDRFPAIH